MAMPSSEELAEYVKQAQSHFTEAEKAKGKDYMLPEPPKPGEYIYCRICNKIMKPEDFSKNTITRKREFKWQMHWDCQQSQFERCDRETPGLVAERQSGLRAGRQLPGQKI